MSPPGAKVYRFSHVYASTGWLSPGYISVDATGTIVDVTDVATREVAAAAEASDGFAIPGMPNVHSHAYLRALAGFAEPTGAASSTFWSWREKMYDLALQLDPDALEAVAAQAFVEMTKAGFTSVAEFHYLHRRPDGGDYDDRTELSERLIASARAAGIGLTLLPALYMHGGIDGPLDARQRRFAFASVDDYLALVETLAARHDESGTVRIGAAPHSVRAVTEGELRRLIDGLASLRPDIPLHMHVAEQRAEVEESLAKRGERPGAWLAHRAPLSSRWTLIHATHCDSDELSTIARSGATVGLCPVTEANLGDGLFPLAAYEASGGRWAIGTDSNTTIGAALELSVLEYGQRLAHERRAVHNEAEPSAGDLLFDAAVQSGATAMGQPIGALQPGKRADIVVFDSGGPMFVGHLPDTFLDTWLVSAGAAAPRSVMVGGHWLVKDGRHAREEEIGNRFASVMRRLHRPA